MSTAAETDLGKKRDKEDLEELDRKVRHMERQITNLKVASIKNQDRTKNDIKKRTKENTQLIQELNSIRLEVKRVKTGN